jgi:hypothetical protein
MKKTTKIKLIATIIVLLVALITIAILTISLNTISYSMQFNAPSRIVVYCDSESGNQVYEPNSKQYEEIYTTICNSYSQTILSAIKSNSLNKKVKIEKVEPTSINFSGIKVNFVYDTPQIVKFKHDIYLVDDETCWYQNLIFSIDNQNKFKYNSVAIIPPSTSNHYVDSYTYSLQYFVYSNFGTTYNKLIQYFLK